MQQRLLDTVRHGFASRDKARWALVIGDLMLDRYLTGEVERISPEAPVPVVLLKQQDERRSEEHTSELQSLMRISYAVFCLKKKETDNKDEKQTQPNDRT